MVAEQLESRGIDDPRVLDACREVPRELFVPEKQRPQAYSDGALPIGQGQTISQPYIVALTCQALEPRSGDRVLDVGTGSGYAAAVLSRIVRRVYSIERLPQLAERAKRRFEELGYDNIVVECRDGTLGWPDEAPFEGIQVAAASPQVPTALLEQLTIGGRLVIPVGASERSQTLKRIIRVSSQEVREESLSSVCFVPLIGAEGWPESPPGI